MAGERSATADIYELHFAPLRLTRLTTVNRVSDASACSSLVVTAAAQLEVGLADTIQVFRNGSFGPVDGLGTPKGFQPALTPDCRLAFSDVDRNSPDQAHRLHVWDPETRSDTVLERAPNLGGLAWGPGGRLAVVLNEGGSPGQPTVSTTLIMFTADRTRTTIPAPAPDLGGFYWSASGTMAFVRVDAKATLFFNPETDSRSELAGWFPLAWSPDGRQLLVSDAENHTELGVVNTSDLSAVERVGTAPVGVYGGVWLPAGATPEVGPAP